MTNCPHCGHDRKKSIGRSRAGFRRYQCQGCRKTWISTEKIPRKETKPRPVHRGCTAPSRRHSLTPDGRRRWFCPDCGKTWTERPRKHRGPGWKLYKLDLNAYWRSYRAQHPEKVKAWIRTSYERRKARKAQESEYGKD